MKVSLARAVADMGVRDFDFVSSTGLLLSGRLVEFSNDIRRVVEAAQGCTTKVVVEFGLIADVGLRRTALRIAEEAGVTYVKQSSGAAAGLPASAEDIRFMKDSLLGKARIKASGGIKTLEGALRLIDAGAQLMGTSAAVSIVTGKPASAKGY
jgi:deoxyribose-phosphate aldolase